MRKLLSTALALALSASTALAADIGPLSPGRPAGLRKAQMEDNTLFIVLGVAVAVGIAVAASSGGNNNNNGATGGGSSGNSTPTST